MTTTEEEDDDVKGHGNAAADDTCPDYGGNDKTVLSLPLRKRKTNTLKVEWLLGIRTKP